ncbi:MAG: hypothetical protein ACK4HE_01510 [Chitinophagaceae bacterium]
MNWKKFGMISLIAVPILLVIDVVYDAITSKNGVQPNEILGVKNLIFKCITAAIIGFFVASSKKEKKG